MALIRMSGGSAKKEETIIPLYDSGNEYTSVSGGWTSDGYSLMSSYTKNANVVKNATNMQLTCSSTNSRYCITGMVNPIDVTDYTMARVYITVANVQYVETLDVTNISGSGYLSVIYYRTSSGTYFSSITLSNLKNYVHTNAIKVADFTHSGATTVYINKIELVKPTYLYKDGTQNVAWDNSGYVRGSSYTCDGGFTLDVANMIGTMPTTNSHNRVIITNSPLDLSNYSTLKVQYDGTQTSSIDISSINASAYIALTTTCNSAGQFYFDAYVSSAKFRFAAEDIKYIGGSGNIKSGTTTFTPKINRVWLE